MNSFIKDRIHYFVLFLLVLTISAGWFFHRKWHYQREIEYLYETAESIGYTEQKLSHFYRSHTRGISASYDYLRLWFTTDKSIDEFSHLVDELGFQQQNSFSYHALFNPKGITAKHAHITYWRLWDTSQQKLVIVEYADATNTWDSEGDEFSGNIVQIQLDRLH